MRSPILRAALFGAAMMSTLAHAEQPVYRFHTEGSNAQSIANHRHLNEVLAGISQDIPFSSVNPAGDISIWYDSIATILDEYERQADKAYVNDQFETAAQRLTEGMAKAFEHVSTQTFGRSITARSLWYGTVVAAKLYPIAQTSETNMRTYSLFVSTYYKLIRSARELDRSFGFEDGNCFECSEGRLQQYEEKLTKLAQDEIQVVLDGLLIPGGAPIPLGSSDGAMYLTAMTLSLAFSADILEASPYRNAYACVIGDMLRVRDNLADGAYSGPVEAVRETVRETRRIIPRISFHSCWDGGFEPREEVQTELRRGERDDSSGYVGDDAYGHRGLKSYPSHPEPLSRKE